MTIDNRLFLDTPTSRAALRDAVVRADLGFKVIPNFEHLSYAESDATLLIVSEDVSWQNVRPDNGVVATREVTFQFTQKGGDLKYWDVYDEETVRGVVALLKAFPDADAYWVALDGEFPMLLRKNGCLVLSAEQTRPRCKFDPTREPLLVSIIDLPYTIEPLGPWPIVDITPEVQRHRVGKQGRTGTEGAAS